MLLGLGVFVIILNEWAASLIGIWDIEDSINYYGLYIAAAVPFVGSYFFLHHVIKEAEKARISIDANNSLLVVERMWNKIFKRRIYKASIHDITGFRTRDENREAIILGIEAIDASRNVDIPLLKLGRDTIRTEELQKLNAWLSTMISSAKKPGTEIPFTPHFP